MTEDLVEMERRHIREGEARVARQEEIVNGIGPGWDPDVAARARDLLALFRESVALSKDRLAALERERLGKPPGSN